VNCPEARERDDEENVGCVGVVERVAIRRDALRVVPPARHEEVGRERVCELLLIEARRAECGTGERSIAE
jgi:hypothetical protein